MDFPNAGVFSRLLQGLLYPAGNVAQWAVLPVGTMAMDESCSPRLAPS